MGKALYRKYRSRSLDEIVGQDHVTDILKNALTHGRISHAYLFTGPRGVGKTSIARILAHEINGLSYNEESEHLDIIEIDAASNNGVDDIRELREKVSLAPSSAAKKVYIIDEVHMLSKPAFNALLKTLEEPPEHVVFILATTDADKLPETIISRTQRYAFKLASPEDIVKNLKRIAKKESIHIDDDALTLIASHSSGSYRDSVSLLDQLTSIGSPDDSITTNDIESALGLAPHEAIEKLLRNIVDKHFTESINGVQQLLKAGIQPTIIALQLIQTIQSFFETYQTLLPMVDKLIAVRQSSMPEALLLATVGIAADDNKQTSRAAVATKRPSIEIPSLVKKATQAHPKEVSNPKAKPVIATTTAKSVPADTPRAVATNSSIDWPAVLDDTSSLSIGLRTVLKKCELADDGDSTVIVYARTEFYKKKLDTVKYRHELISLFTEKTGKEWSLDFIPTQAPSKNKTVANVAAIMGGGEEVNIDD